MKLLKITAFLKDDQTEFMKDKLGDKTLIFSDKNSLGKSTYLRILAFSLGYNIPGMKNLSFDKLVTEVVFENGYLGLLKRNSNTISFFKEETLFKEYSLPVEHNLLLRDIFGNFDLRILENIFGIFYIDQEKGWGLLNRGTAIGRIKFNIEELIAGLNNVDCQKDIERKAYLLSQQNKLKVLQNVSEVQTQLLSESGQIELTDDENELLNKKSLEKIKIAKLMSELSTLNSQISDQEKFFDYLDNLQLQIKVDDKIFSVNRDNVLYREESDILLKSRRDVLNVKIGREKKILLEIDNKLHELYKAQGLFNDINEEERRLNANILKKDIDPVTIADMFEKNEKEIKNISKEIKSKLLFNNPYINDVYKLIAEYGEFLGISKQIDKNPNFIFTNDLKSLSGANLHLLSFCFKLAFFKVVEKKLNIKLPIFIDSPKGSELDDINYDKLNNLINKELENNQVIIASIYSFKGSNKVIKIENKVLELREQN